MKVGDEYIHYKTKDTYKIVGLATLQAPDKSGLDMTVCVIYKKIGDDKLWVRPVAMFEEKVQNSDGRTVKRFNKVYNIPIIDEKFL